MTADREDAMDAEMIDRLREPDFAVRLWGYDRQQVDALLAELHKRARAGELKPTEAEAIEAQLTGIGDRVEAILAAATDTAAHVSEEATAKAAALTRETEQAAEHQRREADSYAQTTRSEADQHASRVRADADREAAKLREQARTEADATVAAAEEEADTIVREAQLERGRIEEAIEALRERRELVIASIERMRGNLSSMVGEAEQGTDAFLAMGEDPDDTRVVFDEEAPASIPPPGDPDADDPLDWSDEEATDEDEFLEDDHPDNGVPVFDVDHLGPARPVDELFDDGERTAIIDISEGEADPGPEATEAFDPGAPDAETTEQDAVEREDSGRH